MQKQRSPYTGGGINLQQLKATTFGKKEILNGIPFLLQLANVVQTQKRPMVHQHLPSLPTHMLGSAGGPGSGRERGLRSGTPHSSLNNNSNSNYHTSDQSEMLPPLSLGQTNSNLPVANDCLHLDDMNNMNNMNNLGNMGDMDHMGNMGDMDHMGNMGHVDYMIYRSQSDQQPESLPVIYQNDTVSEIEYNRATESFDACNEKTSLWRRCFEHLKKRMSPQRQERMEAAWQRYCEKAFCNHVLLVLQLLGILIGGGLHSCMNVVQLSFRMLRCKFQLRSLMRKMLWRMADAKGNDTLLFLGVMLFSPWLFFISLIGFAISFTFQIQGWTRRCLASADA